MQLPAQGRVEDRPEDRRAQALAEIAAEHHGPGHHAALAPAHRGLRPDDRGHREQAEPGPEHERLHDRLPDRGGLGANRNAPTPARQITAPVTWWRGSRPAGTAGPTGRWPAASRCSWRRARRPRPRPRGRARPGRRWAGTWSGPMTRRPRPNPAAADPASTRLRQNHGGRMGSAARRSATAASAAAARATANTRPLGTDHQAQATPPCSRPKISAPAATNMAAAAGHVDPVPGPLHVLVQVAQQQADGDRADRQVDQEDPAPGRVLGQAPAQRRADHRGDAPHAGQPALHPAPFGQVVHVAGQRVHGGLHPARADALQPAEQDQAHHRGRGRAESRPGQEDDGARDQDRLAPPLVGQPPCTGMVTVWVSR